MRVRIVRGSVCVCVFRDRDRECAERWRARVKVVGGSVCLERERWKVCADRRKECVLK